MVRSWRLIAQHLRRCWRGSEASSDCGVLLTASRANPRFLVLVAKKSRAAGAASIVIYPDGRGLLLPQTVTGSALTALPAPTSLSTDDLLKLESTGRAKPFFSLLTTARTKVQRESRLGILGRGHCFFDRSSAWRVANLGPLPRPTPPLRIGRC